MPTTAEARARMHRLLELMREQLAAHAHADQALQRTFDAIVVEFDTGPTQHFHTCPKCHTTYPIIAMACPICHAQKEVLP